MDRFKREASVQSPAAAGGRRYTAPQRWLYLLLFALTSTGWGAIFFPTNQSELALAIDQANLNAEDDVIDLQGLTITLTSPAAGENGLPPILFDGGHRVTIEGSGGILERSANTEASFRLIYIDGGNLTINELTLRNGVAEFAGGAIVNHGTLSLNRCTLSDNEAGSVGGAIYNGADLQISQSTISHNQAEWGGGIACSNEASGTFNMDQSTVSLNSARYDGGGILIDFPGLVGIISNTTISMNTAGTSGGGMYIGFFTSISMLHCTVTQNTADTSMTNEGAGGGIYSEGLSIQATIVAGNHSYTEPFEIIPFEETLEIAPTGVTPTLYDSDVAGIFFSGGNNIIGTKLGSSGFDGHGVTAQEQTPQVIEGDPDIELTQLNLTVDDILEPTLKDNGGATESHNPLEGSIVVDLISPQSCIVQVDQRGTIRPQGDGCDAGSIEFSGPLAPAPALTATLDDELTSDTNHDGLLNPGETLRYTTVITNPHTGPTSTDTTFVLTLDPNTTLRLGSIHTTPIAVPTSVTLFANTPTMITLTGSDADGDMLSFAITTPPSSGTLGAIVPLSPTTAQVLYTPDSNFVGIDQFLFSVTDEDAAVDTAKVALEVISTPPNVPDAMLSAIGNTELVGVGGVATAHGAAFTTTSTNLLANVTDLESPPQILAVLAGSGNSLQGGDYEVYADGTFTYVPPSGYNGSDSFNFTVSDGFVQTVATAHVDVAGMIWYVDNSVGSVGDGRSTNPYRALDNAGLASGPGDTVYVFYGDGSDRFQNVGFSMQTDQRLLGEGVDLVFGSQTLFKGDPGRRPQISGVSSGVDAIDNGNIEIAGLSLNVTAGLGIDITNTVAGASTIKITSNEIAAAFDGIAITGAAGAIELFIDDNIVRSAATGIAINGLSIATVTIRSFANNGVDSAAFGGILISNVTFDADPGPDLVAVDGGVTRIGDPTITDFGLRLGGVFGALGFDSLSITNSGGEGLWVRDGGGKPGNFALSIADGSISTTNGTAIDIDPVALDVTLSQLQSSGGNQGIRLATVTGRVEIQSGHIEDKALPTIEIDRGDVEFYYHGTITNTSSYLLQVYQTTGGLVHLDGPTTLSFTDSGNGIEIDGAAGDVFFSNGYFSGMRGIEITGGPLRPATGNYQINNTTIRPTVPADPAHEPFVIHGGAGNDVLASIDLNNLHIENIVGNPLLIMGMGGGSVDLDEQSGISQLNGQDGISCASNSGGVINLGGQIMLGTATHDAIHLVDNAGATINFKPSELSITTTSGGGFNAEQGGTVTVSGATNSISTATGSALRIEDTTIGDNGVTFKSISTNGAANAIILDNTGDGPFTVTGNFGLTPTGAGGTIQNCTDDAVTLSRTGPVQLQQLTIEANDGHGIYGEDVRGFSVLACKVNENGDAVAKTGSGIQLGDGVTTGVTGTVTIKDNYINLNKRSAISILNPTGTVDLLTVDSNRMSLNLVGVMSYVGSGEHVLADAQITSNHLGSTFDTGIDFDFSGSALANVAIVSNRAEDTNYFSRLTADQDAQVAFEIRNNGPLGIELTPFADGINVEMLADATANCRLHGTISGNHVTIPLQGFGEGIQVVQRGAGTMLVEILNNTINLNDGFLEGIRVETREGVNGNLQATIKNNTIKMTGTEPGCGINMLGGGGAVTDRQTLCIDIAQNTVNDGTAGGAPDYQLVQRFGAAPGDNPFHLDGLGALSGTNAAVVEAFINGRNQGTPDTWVVTSLPRSDVNYTDADCDTPPVDP